jgi:hypothetical protein
MPVGVFRPILLRIEVSVFPHCVILYFFFVFLPKSWVGANHIEHFCCHQIAHQAADDYSQLLYFTLRVVVVANNRLKFPRFFVQFFFRVETHLAFFIKRIIFAGVRPFNFDTETFSLKGVDVPEGRGEHIDLDGEITTESRILLGSSTSSFLVSLLASALDSDLASESSSAN